MTIENKLMHPNIATSTTASSLKLLANIKLIPQDFSNRQFVITYKGRYVLTYEDHEGQTGKQKCAAQTRQYRPS
ncbi:hypothetical protein CCR75_006655 [Bremia lactucae]|uniref:Uncharacterized protein n=1 Tax=Bremia lactucae TaxID=4779 RepID=A0A976FD91_BRELC|nr:hypothetical protein CCR75_006655 [Bremia lactucae]